MKQWLFSVLCLGVAASAWAEPVTRIAFGSCARQDLEIPIWEAVNAFEPDVWIWMGDNIYGDTEDMEVMAAKYAQMKSKPGYVELRQRSRVIGTWDDHDYGVNNGGKEYPAKRGSQRALLDFLDEPADSARRRQEGVYWAYEYGQGERATQIVLLDGRYFRDPPEMEGGDILGEAQWAWLEATLAGSDAPLRIIVSGIQVLHVDHRYEKWANFPQSRERLLELARGLERSRVVFLSGDRHIGEMARLPAESGEPELVEVTSSSLSHSWRNFPGETNRYRVGEALSENNFGAIIIDWETEKLSLQLRGEDGAVEREMEIGLDP